MSYIAQQFQQWKTVMDSPEFREVPLFFRSIRCRGVCMPCGKNGLRLSWQVGIFFIVAGWALGRSRQFAISFQPD
jgi:hypothetical protein